MQARVFHFSGRLGWFGKTVLAVIALALTALLLTFGLAAAVVGLVALAALKLARALGVGRRAEPGLRWERSVVMHGQANVEDPGAVREVEVLRIEDPPANKQP